MFKLISSNILKFLLVLNITYLTPQQYLGLFLLFGPIPFLRGEHVAQKIKTLSGEGATPLVYLLVAGHSGSDGMMGIINGVKSRFTARKLLELSEAPTFERAKQKKGPCRCWFTKNANTVFPGCLSYGAMAQTMAKNILRKGATAWGTLYITKWANGQMSWTQADDEGNEHLGEDGPWGAWNHPEAWNSAPGQQ